jgi:uncharacterized membrane-anchored protein
MAPRWATRRYRATKVAPVDATFWTAKLLSTAMGESTSDFLVHRFNPELAVAGAAVVFVVALVNQLRAPRYLVLAYWWAVVMVGVFGTMCADVIHVALHVPYDVSAPGFAIFLAAVFIAWYRVEGTLSMGTVSTARRELFYWAAVLGTFALGTAVGDFTAYTLNLGYLASFFLFAGAIIVPAALYRLGHVNPVACFWVAHVLTRPVGASLADYLGKPTTVGGLNCGSGPVALVLSAAIVVVVARRAHQVARHDGRRPPVPSR